MYLFWVIQLEERTAVSIWYFYTLSELFGEGKSTVCRRY